MTSSPRARTLAGAALLLLTTAACGTSAASAPAAPAAAPSSTAPSPAAPTTAPPTPSAAPSPSAPRTQAQLEQALLTLDDLPSGYAVDLSPAEDGSEAEVTADDPACAPLVEVLNSPATAGTTATAVATYDGGLDAVSFDAALDALPTPDAARAAVDGQRAAVQACDEVTVEVPEEGPVTFEVVEISVPKLGDSRLGVRLTAVEPEDMAGYELIAIVAAVDEVVAQATFYDAYVEEAEGIMELAVDKIDEGSGGSST